MEFDLFQQSLVYSRTPAAYLVPPHQPNRVFTEWYGPLVRRGFNVPFFLVLDLGLMFMEGGAFILARDDNRSGNRDIHDAYLGFLTQLQTRGSTHALIQQTRRELLNLFPRRHEEARRQAQRTAALPFLEACLMRAAAKCNDLLALDAADIEALSFNPDLWANMAARAVQPTHLTPEVQETYEKFLRTMLGSVGCWPYQPGSVRDDPLPLAAADVRLIRAAYLAPRRLLDMLLLANTQQHFRLRADRRPDHALNRVKRRIPIPIESKSYGGEGGYEGIINRGRWSNLLPSQLAQLRVNQVLFLQSYYDKHVLYYDRRTHLTRPLAILIALFFQSDTSMRRSMSGLLSGNALAREVGAYLVEDAGVTLGGIEGLTLDFHLAPYASSPDWPPLHVRLGDDHRALVEQDQPVMSHPGLIDFFRLETLLSPHPTQGTDPVSGISQLKFMATQDNLEYDSGHVVLLGSQRLDETHRVTLRRLVQGFIHHPILHFMQIGPQGVEWAVVDRVETIFESYQDLRLVQTIRGEFVHRVAQEALRV